MTTLDREDIERLINCLESMNTNLVHIDASINNLSRQIQPLTSKLCEISKVMHDMRYVNKRQRNALLRRRIPFPFTPEGATPPCHNPLSPPI